MKYLFWLLLIFNAILYLALALGLFLGRWYLPIGALAIAAALAHLASVVTRELAGKPMPPRWRRPGR